MVYAAFLLLFSLTPSPLAGEPHLRITATLPSEVVCFHVVPVTLTIKNTDREETAVFPPPELRLIGVTIANAATGQIEYEGPVAVSRSSVEREPPRPVQLPPGGEFKIPFILRCRWIADAVAGFEARVVAHEIGHQCGLFHWDSGEPGFNGALLGPVPANLMKRSLNYTANANAYFVDEHLHLLRSRVHTPDQ